MPQDDNFTDFERDMNRRKPNPRHGTPWIGTELDESGETVAAFPGTGTSIPQDIGAGGFEVEAPEDEPRDDLSDIATDKPDISPADDFDTDDLNTTPGVDGTDAVLSTLHADRPSRVDQIDEDETPLDRNDAQPMGMSAEIGEMPMGSENISPGEPARYQCPNCGHEYDIVVGTAARCPACNFEADLSNYIGDEGIYYTESAVDFIDREE